MCSHFNKNLSSTRSNNSAMYLNRPKITKEIRFLYIASFVFFMIVFFISIFGRKLFNTDNMILYFSFKKYHNTQKKLQSEKRDQLV